MENKKQKDHQKSKDKSSKKDIKRLRSERDELKEKYQRALADYQNLLKRQVREKEELIKYSNEKLIEEFIPVFDNLKIALEHTSEEENDSKWVEGVRYVVKQFREVLTDNGIEEIKTEEKKFNPKIMEAIEGEGEYVKKEIRSGYALKGKIIIPAKVVLEDDDKKENK
ncbi:nucleotide exchange factor GrpE [bacterium]|nr:nucleotide exchange factor GrpE [bacterium]